MIEKVMVYVFLRSRVVIDPAEPDKQQHFTFAHYVPVPADEVDDLDHELIERYGFDTVPSETREEIEAQGFDIELSWHVTTIVTPTAEEFAAAQAEAAGIPVTEAGIEANALAVCADGGAVGLTPEQADAAASSVIMGAEQVAARTEGAEYS